jgi:chromosomal replication initiation ATPase DnaA
MQLYAFKATERGIQERNSAQWANERINRLAAQRAAWEAEQAARLADRERIDRIRADAVERAAAYAQELKRAGYRYRPSIAEIERRAMRVFGVTKAELRSNRRHREICFAMPVRHVLDRAPDAASADQRYRRYPEKRAKMAGICISTLGKYNGLSH